jgi:hypothetical protein
MKMFRNKQLADYANCFFRSLTLEDVERQYTALRKGAKYGIDVK